MWPRTAAQFLISQFGKVHVSGETPLMSACYGRVSEPDQLGVQSTLVCAAIIHVNGIYTSVQAEVSNSITVGCRCHYLILLHVCIECV